MAGWLQAGTHGPTRRATLWQISFLDWIMNRGEGLGERYEL